MAEIICVDKNYSATQLLTRDLPLMENKPEEKIENVFLLLEGEPRKGEGGLRTQGYFKENLSDKPLITIVTVVLNGEKFLEETILSVINQTYNNVEYIIVDGGSTDGTLDIIRKYENVIDYWVSELDKGIYDAMNKSIELCCGKWINFMNAGDFFYDDGVLSKVFENSQGLTDYDVVYGDHEVRYPHKTSFVKAGKIKDLWKGSQFCHQSAFVRLTHHKRNKFNLCRKIAADFEFFYKSADSGSKMYYQPLTLSSVSAGGVSDSKRIQSIFERYFCLNNRLPKLPYYLLLASIELVKLIIKRYVDGKP